MNAIELVNGHHEPVPWIVGGLLRPGFTCLAGSQSSGKSILLANVAVSIPEGEPLFGHYLIPEPRPVIMCAMEETPGDIARYLEVQYRSRNIGLNPQLHIYTELPAAGGGGLEELEELVTDLRPGVVIIDLFSDYDPIPSTYNAARAKIATWNRRAQEWDCAIVGTLHAQRGGIPASGDWMHKVQGSFGALGAMVVRIGLARIQGSNQSVLRVTGKGTQDHDLTLSFDPATQLFTAGDATPDDSKPDTMRVRRRLILEVVAAQDPAGIEAPMVAHKVAAMAAERREPVDLSTLTYDNLRQIMHQMVHDPTVDLQRVDGRYFTTAQLDAIRQPPVPELDAESAA